MTLTNCIFWGGGIFLQAQQNKTVRWLLKVVAFVREFYQIHPLNISFYPPGLGSAGLPHTHLCRCGGAACRSSAPLWHSSPPRCSRARTLTPPDARAPWAAPSCCCRAAWPPGAPCRAGARRPRPAGCGCGACWGSARAPPRCAGTSACPGWWTGTCWCPPPAGRRKSGAAAAAARGGGATLSREESVGEVARERAQSKCACRERNLYPNLIRPFKKRQHCVDWFIQSIFSEGRKPQLLPQLNLCTYIACARITVRHIASSSIPLDIRVVTWNLFVEKGSSRNAYTPNDITLPNWTVEPGNLASAFIPIRCAQKLRCCLRRYARASRPSKGRLV